MNQGSTVFSQLIQHLPDRLFRRIVARYGGNRRIRSFSCWDQLLCMTFAQLTHRESLRDIETCFAGLGRAPLPARHPGARLPQHPRRRQRETRLADLRRVRTQGHRPRTPALQRRPFGLELEQTVYALDSSTIDLCLSLFPWARVGRERSSIRLHTLLDLHGNIPANVWITTASFSDNRILDVLLPEPGSIYIMDRGYLDFARLAYLDRCRAVFVVRAKSNLAFRRLYSHPVDRSTGLICDQTIVLTNPRSADHYPNKLRRVRFRDDTKDEAWTYVTNDFDLPALTVAELYRSRWQIELFFKWIKQHLKIKTFYGYSDNAVRTQIWIAITTYVLVAIVRRRLEIEADLYTLLQLVGLFVFEKAPLPQLLTGSGYTTQSGDIRNQLSLFDL